MYYPQIILGWIITITDHCNSIDFSGLVKNCNLVWVGHIVMSAVWLGVRLYSACRILGLYSSTKNANVICQSMTSIGFAS